MDKEAYEKANLKDDQQRKNRFNGADSDESADKFERRRKRRDHSQTSRGPRNQDKNQRTRVQIADRDDSENTSYETDADSSSGDRDKDGHRRKRRKSNERVSETSKTIDGSPSSQSVINDPDMHGNCSDRNKDRRPISGEKPKKHWDEVPKDSDNQMKQKSKLKTDYESKKSSTGKICSRQLESGSRDFKTGDSHSIDSLHSDVVSDENQEASISDRYVERFKPLDLSEHIEKEGRWDPERSYEDFEKPSETTSAVHYDSGSPVHYGERSKTDVLGTVYYHDDKVNKQDHSKHRSSDLSEHRRSRRKSSRHDDDQTYSDLKSENKNSDEDYLQKNLRRTSHSRTRRHRHS